MFSRDWGSQKISSLLTCALVLGSASSLFVQKVQKLKQDLTPRPYFLSVADISESVKNPWKTREMTWDTATDFKLIEFAPVKVVSHRKKQNIFAKKHVVHKVIISQAHPLHTVTHSTEFAESYFDFRITLEQQIERLLELRVSPVRTSQKLKPIVLSQASVKQAIKVEVNQSQKQPLNKSVAIPTPTSEYSLKKAAKLFQTSRDNGNFEYPNQINEENQAPSEYESLSDPPVTILPTGNTLQTVADPPTIENEIKIEIPTAQFGVGPQPKTAQNPIIRIQPKQDSASTQANNQTGSQSNGQSGYSNNRWAQMYQPWSCTQSYQKYCLSRGLSLAQNEQPYEDVSFKVLSYEGEAGKASHVWGITYKKENWDTVSYEEKTLTSPVPLLPIVSVQALAQFRKTEIQPDTSIIFGKLQPGNTVQIGKADGSSADAVLYIDEEDHRQEISFIFLNVSPGPQLLYIYDQNGKVVGGVATPALANRATYLDLRAINKGTLAGFFLSAGAATPQPLAKTIVRVVGQWENKTLTNELGRFSLAQVNQIGSYPLYLESECGSGYTHRYRVNADKASAQTYYCFSESQIQSWMLQFQGGVSEDSGAFIGAIPEIAKKYDEGELFPELKTLALRGATTPEIYTLSPEGRAQIQTPLDQALPRFLGIQLPDASLVSEVVDRSQKVVWSEMVFSSPKVLQVLGPN